MRISIVLFIILFLGGCNSTHLSHHPGASSQSALEPCLQPRQAKATLENDPTLKGVPKALIVNCLGCHTLDGKPLVGPSLKGIYGAAIPVITNKGETDIIADEPIIRLAVTDPGKYRYKGFDVLKTDPGLTEAEWREIFSYLKNSSGK